MPLLPAGAVSLATGKARKARNSTSLRLRLPPPTRPVACRGVSLAAVASTLYYGRPQDCGSGWGPGPERQRCSRVTTYDAEVEVAGLEPYTEYVFMVTQTNHYSTVRAEDAPLGPTVVLKTAAGAPTPPRELRLRAEDPSTVRVWWKPPERLNAESVWYELHWRAEGPGPGARTSGQDAVPELQSGSLLTATLSKLAPGQGYSIWVRAHAALPSSEDSDADAVEDAHADSAVAVVRTLPEPGPLTLERATPHSLAVAWTPPSATLQSMQSVALRYCVAATGTAACRTQAVPPDQPVVVLAGLQPKTNYSLHLEMTFPHSTQAFTWPGDARFTFETLGDRPGPPGTPVIQHIHRAVYQVTWQPSEPNGAPVQLYTLDGWVRRKPVTPAPPLGQRDDLHDDRQEPQWLQDAPRSRRQADEATEETEEPEEPQWETLYNGSGWWWHRTVRAT